MDAHDLEIQLLGPLEVRRGRVRLDLPPSRKARALLAYLVTTDRAHSRSALCDLFWCDVNDPRAGLRWALSKLRSALDGTDGSPFATSRDLVEFDRSRVRVDVHEVEAVVESGAETTDADALGRAARVFRGPFLEGLELPSCHQFEAWSLGLRERWRSRHVEILSVLVESLDDDPEGALPHALERLSIDPYSEEAYASAARCFGRLGRTDEALLLLGRCHAMCAEYLGREPSRACAELRHQLEGGGDELIPGVRTAEKLPTASRETEARSGDRTNDPPPGPSALSPIGSKDPPLVGRATAMEQIGTMLRSVGGGGEPSALLLSGEPGIGKTRLLRELLSQVEGEGGRMLSGKVFESEGIRPYGPWIDLLRQIPRAELRRASEGRLGPLFGVGNGDAPPGGPEERSQLFGAAAETLRRIALRSGPMVLALDDVQWLDGASSALLHYLVRTLVDEPILFALAARDREIPGAAAVARSLRSLGESGHLLTIRVRRLDAEETGRLIQAVDPAVDSGAVYSRSEGNPLFALAIADSWQAEVDRLPETVQEELEGRLQRLDDRCRSLLPWAAALGRAFDVPTLLRVMGRPADELVETLGELERGGVLRASGPDQYDFSHSLLREAAYRQISEPVRRTIHREIAGSLHALERSEGRVPGAIAHHAERGGQAALSAAAYAEAAEDSLWVFAFEEAAELVERGLAQLAGLSAGARLPLELDLLRIYTSRSMQEQRPEWVEARVRTVTDEATRFGRQSLVAIGHALQMELEFQRGAFEAAQKSSVRSAEAGRSGGPEVATRALADTAACLLILDRSPRDARRLVREAEGLAREHDLDLDILALARALLHHLDGELSEAARGFDAVVRIGRRARDRWWESQAMTRMVMVELDRGEPERARTRARDAAEIADRARDAPEAAFARGLLAVAQTRSARSEARKSGVIAADSPAKPDHGRDGEGGPSDNESLDTAIDSLRLLDSLWHIAHLEAYGAEDDLNRGDPVRAGERATEVERIGELLERPSLLALGNALLALSAACAGNPEERERRLSSPEILAPEHTLSARALQVVERARSTPDRGSPVHPPGRNAAARSALHTKPLEGD